MIDARVSIILLFGAACCPRHSPPPRFPPAGPQAGRGREELMKKRHTMKKDSASAAGGGGSHRNTTKTESFGTPRTVETVHPHRPHQSVVLVVGFLLRSVPAEASPPTTTHASSAASVFLLSAAQGRARASSTSERIYTSFVGRDRGSSFLTNKRLLLLSTSQSVQACAAPS